MRAAASIEISIIIFLSDIDTPPHMPSVLAIGGAKKHKRKSVKKSSSAVKKTGVRKTRRVHKKSHAKKGGAVHKRKSVHKKSHKKVVHKTTVHKRKTVHKKKTRKHHSKVGGAAVSIEALRASAKKFGIPLSAHGKRKTKASLARAVAYRSSGRK